MKLQRTPEVERVENGVCYGRYRKQWQIKSCCAVPLACKYKTCWGMSTVFLKLLTKMDEKFLWPQLRKWSISVTLKAGEELGCLDHTTESQVMKTGVPGQTHALFYRPPWASHSLSAKVWSGLKARRKWSASSGVPAHLHSMICKTVWSAKIAGAEFLRSENILRTMFKALEEKYSTFCLQSLPCTKPLALCLLERKNIALKAFLSNTLSWDD